MLCLLIMMILLCLFQPKGCDLMYNEHPRKRRASADTGDQGGCEAVNLKIRKISLLYYQSLLADGRPLAFIPLCS